MNSLAFGLRLPLPGENAALGSMIGSNESSDIDWQEALEGLVLNNISLSGAVDVGVSIPVGAIGFVDIGVGVTPKIYECIDLAENVRKTQLKVELDISVSGGVGNSVDLSKYSLPGSPGNTHQDQLRRIKRVSKKPATPRKIETNGLTDAASYRIGGSAEQEDGGYCPICKDNWDGVVKLGPFGEASAGASLGVYGFVSWQLGNKFAWNKFKLGIETDFGFKFAVDAKIGVKGQGQGVWYKTLNP